MKMTTLCTSFGVPPSTLSRTLKKAEEAFQITLRQLPEAAIKWPTVKEQYQCGLKVQVKYPKLIGRWGLIDGKNYRVQKPSSVDLQNAIMFNGWLHATFVTGCLCFGIDGCLLWGKHNVVGSWNDGDISRPFQEKLLPDDINLPGHGVLSDSSFPVRGPLFGRIMSFCSLPTCIGSHLGGDNEG
ncbi:unnamed protein product [Ectocarpus fasciculatus]